MEESGVKWVMEHLDRWVRNVQTSNLHTTKPSYCQTIISEIADYTWQTSICQTFIAKNPYKICRILWEFCRILWIKIYKGLDNIRKPGEMVWYCIVYYTRGIVVSFDPPLRGCLLVLAMIAGAGDRKSMIDTPIGIRYNSQTLSSWFEGLTKVWRFDTMPMNLEKYLICVIFF